MLMNRKNSFSGIIYAISMLFPAAILYVCMYYDGIFFGSEKTILLYDMGAQYAPFISYLGKLGDGFNNLMYQSLSGMGGSFFGTWAYYLVSPLSFIVLLFDEYHLPDAIYLIVLIKIALCGLTMCIYLKKGHLEISNPFILLISSCSYALMSYNMMYMILPMWLDGVIMLPLVILGVDYVLCRKSGVFFIIAFSLSVILNYYTAYMIAIFAVIYYLYRIFSVKTDRISFRNSFLTLALSSIISVMLSAWIWIPVYMDFKRGKLAEGDKEIPYFIRNVFHALRQLLPASYDGVNPSDAPGIYCGIIFTVLLILVFISKKFSLRKKIVIFFVFAFYFFSFCFGYLDVLWHGMKIPNCLPARYSFTFTFFLIFISAELISLLISDIGQKGSSSVRLQMICIALLTVSVADLGINSLHIIRSVESDDNTGKRFNRQDYETMVSISDFIRSDLYSDGRVLYSSYEYSSNDGLMFGIPTLDYFSSSYNLGLSSFMRKLGVDYVFNIDDDHGLNAANMKILGVGYVAEFGNAFNGQDIQDFLDPVYGDDAFRIYGSEPCLEYGFTVPYFDPSTDLSYDPFYNVNLIYSDITGIADIFDECETERVRYGADSGFAFTEKLTVIPQAGRHLYFYVSPVGFYEDDFSCNDELYFGDELIAKFVDVGSRYIVDMGYSDGTPLNFKYSSANADSEVYFYTLDHEALLSAISRSEQVISNVKSSSKGLNGALTLDRDSQVVFRIPYENGFTVRIDGADVPYSDYRGGFVMVPVTAGDHEYHISFIAPGFVFGVAVSGIGMLIFAGYVIKRRKNLF